MEFVPKEDVLKENAPSRRINYSLNLISTCMLIRLLTLVMVCRSKEASRSDTISRLL